MSILDILGALSVGIVVILLLAALVLLVGELLLRRRESRSDKDVT